MRAGSTGSNSGGGRGVFGAANPVSRTASMRMCAEALWLARKEIRWSWSSYVWSVSIVLCLGLAAAVSLSVGVSGFETVVRERGMEASYSAFFADYLFLLACALFGTTALLGLYAKNERGTSVFGQSLPRRVPLSAGVIVGGHALGRLFVLVLGVFAFFVPVYFLSGLGEELGTGAFLCFCAFWVGYALVGSGLSVFFGFGVSGRSYALISYAFALPLMILVVFLETTRYAGLVGRVALVAQGGHGALLAGLSVVAGGAAFLLLSRSTVRRLRAGDLPA